MRVFSSGMKAVDRLFGKGVCLLLVVVFICSFDRSNSSNVATENTIDTPFFRHPSSLTPKQHNSAVTIEFDFTHIDRKNRTALNIALNMARLEVRRKILEYLNRRKRTTASVHSTTMALQTTTAVVDAIITRIDTTTPPSTTTSPSTIPTSSIAATPTTTPAILTTPTTSAVKITTAELLTTAAKVPGPARRRRRRQNSGENDDTFTDENIPFVDIDPEFDENGNLRLTIFLNETGLGDLSHLELDDIEFEELLYIVALAFNQSGELEEAAKAPVVAIYKGLPARMEKLQTASIADYLAWLSILLGFLLLLITCIVCCLRDRNQKKVKDEKKAKIIPRLHPYAYPLILDDNCGWIVPYEHFNNAQITE